MFITVFLLRSLLLCFVTVKLSSHQTLTRYLEEAILQPLDGRVRGHVTLHCFTYWKEKSTHCLLSRLMLFFRLQDIQKDSIFETVCSAFTSSHRTVPNLSGLVCANITKNKVCVENKATDKIIVLLLSCLQTTTVWSLWILVEFCFLFGFSRHFHVNFIYSFIHVWFFDFRIW